MNGTQHQPGVANVALVLSEGADDQAVVTQIVVEAVHAAKKRTPKRPSLAFAGPVAFDKPCKQHVRRVVIPCACDILMHLGIRLNSVRISATNLNCATAQRQPLTICGYSADASILLATLSHALGVPVPADLLATGHLASVAGHIRHVAYMAQKIDAAWHDGRVKRMLIPSVETDRSLNQLMPGHADKISDRIGMARAALDIDLVENIAQLIQRAMPEECVMLAALRGSYFNLEDPDDHEGLIKQAASHLAGQPSERFWRLARRTYVMHNHALAGRLLDQFVTHHARLERYPRGFGQRLRELYASLPPSIIRSLDPDSWADTAAMMGLGRFAGADDAHDVAQLHQVIERTMGSADAPSSSKQPCRPSGGDTAVVVALKQISPQHMAELFGQDIDEARSSFVVDDVTADNKACFEEIIQRFYCHLCISTNMHGADPDSEITKGESHQLVEKAFAREGGAGAALFEARQAVHGGLRFVLDRMTEQFKQDRQANHVETVLRQAASGGDRAERQAFWSALMDRIRPMLSSDVRDIDPAAMGDGYQEIIQRYVEAVQNITEQVRHI